MKGEKNMPSYYTHSAVCKKGTLKNRSFVLGVEVPDLLKKYIKLYGSEKAGAKFNVLRTKLTPEYSQLRIRAEQKETQENNDGLHYGVSSNPDVRACWNDFKKAGRIGPFERGYVWHLLTDKLIYSRLDIDRKFKAVLEAAGKEQKNIDEIKAVEVKKLHKDWDKINARIRDTYPEVQLTEEVRELGVVQFEEGELFYVDWDVVKDTIDYLRTFDPLNGDMDSIIEEVLSQIK